MDAILNWGIKVILFLQSLGSWLNAPMNFFSFFGNELFFLFIAPAIFWCVDATLGMRAGLGLLASLSINAILKLAFHAPRPYWYDVRVQPFSSETSFGIPSAHSQNSVVLWSLLAKWVKRPLAWAAAVAMILLVSLSRMVLGMHFPSDVLAGWVLGLLLVWAILALRKTCIRLAKKPSNCRPGDSSFRGLPGVDPDRRADPAGAGRLDSPERLGGAGCTRSRRSADHPSGAHRAGLIRRRVSLGWRWGASCSTGAAGSMPVGHSGCAWGALLVGLAGVFIIWYGLDKLFPDGDTVIPLFLRYLRYAAVGLWMSYLAPLIFFRLKLAHPKYQ